METPGMSSKRAGKQPAREPTQEATNQPGYSGDTVSSKLKQSCPKPTASPSRVFSARKDVVDPKLSPRSSSSINLSRWSSNTTVSPTSDKLPTKHAPRKATQNRPDLSLPSTSYSAGGRLDPPETTPLRLHVEKSTLEGQPGGFTASSQGGKTNISTSATSEHVPEGSTPNRERDKLTQQVDECRKQLWAAEASLRLYDQQEEERRNLMLETLKKDKEQLRRDLELLRGGLAQNVKDALDEALRGAREEGRLLEDKVNAANAALDTAKNDTNGRLQKLEKKLAQATGPHTADLQQAETSMQAQVKVVEGDPTQANVTYTAELQQATNNVEAQAQNLEGEPAQANGRATDLQQVVNDSGDRDQNLEQANEANVAYATEPQQVTNNVQVGTQNLDGEN